MRLQQLRLVMEVQVCRPLIVFQLARSGEPFFLGRDMPWFIPLTVVALLSACSATGSGRPVVDNGIAPVPGSVTYGEVAQGFCTAGISGISA